MPLVSDAAGAVCVDGVDGLVHPAGDVDRLTAQLTEVNDDRGLLRRLGDAGLRTAREQTWEHAGERLLRVYEDVVDASGSGRTIDELPRAIAS